MATSTRSGNPAKKAAAKKAEASVSAAAAFKQRKAGQLLPLPSGLTVRAKRVELTTFIRQGNVPNPLMQVVNEALEKGQKMDPKAMVGENLNLDDVREMYEMVDEVVKACVVEPTIHSMPTQEDLVVWNDEHPDDLKEDPDELRDDDIVYTDDVDDEDKMFLFQWASGGTSDIERFRQEASANLAALAEG